MDYVTRWHRIIIIIIQVRIPPHENSPLSGLLIRVSGGFHTVGALRPVVCRIICRYVQYVPVGKKECKDQVGGTVEYLINHTPKQHPKLSASLLRQRAPGGDKR